MQVSSVFEKRNLVRAQGHAAQPVLECILDVTVPPQELTEWCWAAVAVGIANAYGDTAEAQCDVAERVLSCDCCGNDADLTGCNQPHLLKEPLNTHCGAITNEQGHQTSDFVKRCIDAGFPIAVKIKWANTNANRGTGGSGHYVVIRGYREMTSPSSFELHVGDPQYPLVATNPMVFEHFLFHYLDAGFWKSSYETSGAHPVAHKSCNKR